MSPNGFAEGTVNTPIPLCAHLFVCCCVRYSFLTFATLMYICLLVAGSSGTP